MTTQYTSEPLPFVPFDSTLKEVLKSNHIKKVATWLLGREDTSILAQYSNSLWESGLSIIFLLDYVEILSPGEEQALANIIKNKSTLVARWLKEKKTETQDQNHVHWDGVTWDTCVVLRCLGKILKQYPDEFSDHERDEIRDCLSRGIAWLYSRFIKWESEIKYPFGPADVAQIISTLIIVRSDYAEIYANFLSDIKRKPCELESTIVRYLLHIKTEKTLTIPITSEEDEEVVTYWWDDYFSTSEVVEALAIFYKHYERDVELTKVDGKIIGLTRIALIRACAYFEQGQVDGMWGSHIDTIKVINAYVRIRSLIPHSTSEVNEPLIVPEIHTTFKALRWMCDEKQIFSDGSFLHTMFLTIFYAPALIEIYNNWKPANLKIMQLYDDVIWFSPVRTTPERVKRLSAELQIIKLKKRNKERKSRIFTYSRVFRLIIVLFPSLFLFTFLGYRFKVFMFVFKVDFSSDNALNISFFAFSVPALMAILGLAWYWGRIFKK